MRGGTSGVDVFGKACCRTQRDAWICFDLSTRLEAGALSGVFGVGIEHDHRNMELLVNNANGFGQIGIIRHDDHLIAVLAKGINQHVGRKIYIRTFFLHFDDANGRARGGRRRRCETHVGGALEVVSVMNREIRQRLKRADVGFLSLSALWIARIGVHQSCKVADSTNLNARQHGLRQRFEVYPFEGCSLCRSIIEIEAVDVDVRFWHKG